MADNRKESDPVDFLRMLPVEMALGVIFFLDHLSLASASLVSRTWQQLCRDKSVWPEIYRNRWPTGKFSPLLRQETAVDYFKAFRARLELEEEFFGKAGRARLAMPDLVWPPVDAEGYCDAAKCCVNYVLDRSELFAEGDQEIGGPYMLASEEYASALALDTKCGRAFAEWGWMLYESGTMCADDALTERLMMDSLEMLEHAAVCYPEAATITFFRARCYDFLSEIAMQQEQPEKEEQYLRLSIAFLEKARLSKDNETTCPLAPIDSADLAYSEGVALTSLVELQVAEQADGPPWENTREMIETLDNARDMLLQCLQIEPTFREANTTLALTRSKRALLMGNETEVARLHEQAHAAFQTEYELFTLDLDDNNDYDRVYAREDMFRLLSHWGDSLNTRADQLGIPAGRPYYELAIAKIEESLQYQEFSLNAYNLGRCNCAMSQCSEDPEQSRKYKEKAVRAYQTAIDWEECPLKLKEYTHEWAFTLLTYAQRQRAREESGERTEAEESSEALFEEAAEKLSQLWHDQYWWAGYSLARLSAVRGNDELCRSWMETYMASDDVPKATPAAMVKERLLRSVHNKDWFIALVKKYEEDGRLCHTTGD